MHPQRVVHLSLLLPAAAFRSAASARHLGHDRGIARRARVKPAAQQAGRVLVSHRVQLARGHP